MGKISPDPIDLSDWDSQGEIEMLRSHCRSDFWSFFLYAFGAGLNPKGIRWIDDEVHYPLAKWFQHHIDEWLEWRRKGEERQKHLAILVHREIGKTTMLTRAGQLWLHLRDPEMATAVGAENMKLSKKMLDAMKAVLDGTDGHALFPLLYGNWAEGARKWTGEEIVHTARKNTSRQDPSFVAFAVETSITGSHPDAIFYDDPISYERLESDTNWLAAVKSQVDSLRYVIQGDGLVVWVGTRYDDLDHFGDSFNEEGVRSLAGIETDQIEVDKENGVWDAYFMAGRDNTGKPTTPKVWPEARLRRAQKKNPIRYAAQIMNDPTSASTNPITKEQLEQSKIDKSLVPFNSLRIAICTDVAFSDGKRLQGKDETTFYVHGYPRNGSGDVYILEGDGSHLWREEEFSRRLVSTVQRYRSRGFRVFAITGETSRAGLKGVLHATLKNRFADAGEPMPQYIEFERGNQHKYQRLQTAATFWVDGHVRCVAGAPGIEELLKQMARIGQYAVNPRIKIDRADAHSDAFQPELYQTMRRTPLPQRDPYLKGATGLSIPGLDDADYEDEWTTGNPRPPIRG